MYRPRPTSRRCLRAKCVRGRKLIALDCAFAVRATSKTSAPAGNRASGGRSARIRLRSGSLISRRPSRRNRSRLTMSPPRAASHLVSWDEPGATPVALHFILPPNFRAAWAKGEVMVCVEAEFDGRRVMLDALPREQRFGCDDGDLAIIEYLSDSLGRAAAGMNMLGASAFLDLLPILRGHPRLSFGKAKACSRLPGNSPPRDHSSSRRRGI